MATLNSRISNGLLEKQFPNLGNNSAYYLNYAECNPLSKGAGYNCIAHAAGDYSKYWWPNEDFHWPAGIPRTEDISSFIICFESLGFIQCGLNDHFEQGFEKVAIYVDNDFVVQHMAKQFTSDNGCWRSKLGPQGEIKHWLGGLAGYFGGMCGNYGNVGMILKKKASLISI